MEPTTILAVIKVCVTAIDGAIKIKEGFFGNKNTDSLKLHEKKLDEFSTKIEENRDILKKQNEIIIELGNALKVTAETARRTRITAIAATVVSAVSIIVAICALLR